ncbi:uncharacterized protein LOC119206046 [Pungitius pungitius]|uniref:uncharacterized protein LOC134107839 n=1 Tax=Pungitius pungitius TaxID=134920 RepID=UPI002E110844
MEKARYFSHFMLQGKMASPELALVIERAVAAGVRAALQDRPTPTPGTSLVATDTTSLPSVSAVISSPSTATTSQRSVPLPSFPQRSGARPGLIRRRPYKTFTKDIVCLPWSTNTIFSIPRGDTRTKLAEDGLIGKISFSSEWSEVQLKLEITAIFRATFGLSENQEFPFEYLCTIKGCKKLMKPKVTNSFPWGGKEVASICSNTCLYILAGMQRPAEEEFIAVSDDSDFEDPAPRRRRALWIMRKMKLWMRP